MLERLFGRGKETEKKAQQQMQQHRQNRQLSADEQAMVDTLNRPSDSPGSDEQKLRAIGGSSNIDDLVNRANKRADEFASQGMSPVDIQINPPAVSIESIAQGKMPETKAPEQQQSNSPEQKQNDPEQFDVEKFKTDFKQELVEKHKLSPQNAEKLASLYTEDLAPIISENEMLQQHLSQALKTEIPKDPGKLRKFIIQSLFPLAISGALAAVSGNYIWMVPSVLMQGMTVYTRLKGDEQNKFIEAFNTQKEALGKLSLESQKEIASALQEIDQAIMSKQVDPQIFQQNIEIIREHNAKLANQMQNIMVIKDRADTYKQAQNALTQVTIKPQEQAMLRDNNNFNTRKKPIPQQSQKAA